MEAGRKLSSVDVQGHMEEYRAECAQIRSELDRRELHSDEAVDLLTQISGSLPAELC
jgi:hypothetical protein